MAVNKMKEIVDNFLSMVNTDNFLSTVNTDTTIYGNYFRGQNPIIYFNEKIVAYKQRNIIIIENTISSKQAYIEMLNYFPGIKAEIKNDDIYINDMYWDGSKVNLELFYID